MIRKDRFFTISNLQISQVRKAFENYIKKFYTNNSLHNQHYEIKRFHTKKVCENILEIGHSLEMNKEQLNFLELLAWMHDIGRFEQYRKYQTFSDAESENHSLIAIRVICKENILSFLTVKQKDIIFLAILNHNLRRVPKNEELLVDFYSRILRDADKLDIWRITIEMNIMFKIQDEPLPVRYSVPSAFLQEYINKCPLRIEQASNIYDTTLFRLSWLFDLNFTRSFELMKEREISEKLLKKVPDSAKLQQIRTLVNKYLEEKCLDYSFSERTT